MGGTAARDGENGLRIGPRPAAKKMQEGRVKSDSVIQAPLQILCALTAIHFLPSASTIPANERGGICPRRPLSSSAVCGPPWETQRAGRRHCPTQPTPCAMLDADPLRRGSARLDVDSTVTSRASSSKAAPRSKTIADHAQPFRSNRPFAHSTHVSALNSWETAIGSDLPGVLRHDQPCFFPSRSKRILRPRLNRLAEGKHFSASSAPSCKQIRLL